MVWMLNVIVPGSGLVLRRREWLGLLLSLVFAICANLAVAGWLVAPAAVPRWLTILAALLAVGSWLFAQYLYWAQGAVEVRRAQTVAGLLTEARSSLLRHDFDAADRELAAAAELDADNHELADLRSRAQAGRNSTGKS